MLYLVRGSIDGPIESYILILPNLDVPVFDLNWSCSSIWSLWRRKNSRGKLSILTVRVNLICNNKSVVNLQINRIIVLPLFCACEENPCRVGSELEPPCMNIVLFDNLCLYADRGCPELYYVVVLDVDPRYFL